LDEKEAYRRAVEKVIASAGKTMVLFSGGSRIGDEDLLHKARICMASGATGLIFGRNMWQRPFEEGLKITHLPGYGAGISRMVWRPGRRGAGDHEEMAQGENIPPAGS